jgi:hypothetical protein
MKPKFQKHKIKEIGYSYRMNNIIIYTTKNYYVDNKNHAKKLWRLYYQHKKMHQFNQKNKDAIIRDLYEKFEITLKDKYFLNIHKEKLSKICTSYEECVVYYLKMKQKQQKKENYINEMWKQTAFSSFKKLNKEKELNIQQQIYEDEAMEEIFQDEIKEIFRSEAMEEKYR